MKSRFDQKCLLRNVISQTLLCQQSPAILADLHLIMNCRPPSLARLQVNIRMDASKNGCTGMFWRSKPEMNASVSAPDWPRNGTVFKGWKSLEHPGWVKVDHPKGYWLPIQQYGNDVCHFP
ncbi:hypothetical protein Vretifemale_19966 [Volvox reticuliferus]|uniref:Uncharacterized protein n=1 Tax=Volvox reticuliferus TaxID=1737510 RepID=A0A8J4G156_9CHLO|nr:hypothetical protein Vretifemale_19966 [Volvox reticuliferus]